MSEALASELKNVYKEVRCRYLHSGPIEHLEADALRSAKAAYDLLRVFLGFPADLFRFTNQIECLNVSDPRFVAFYRPHLRDADEQGNKAKGGLTNA